MKKDVNQVQEEVDGMKPMVGNVATEVEEVKKNVAHVATDVSQVKGGNEAFPNYLDIKSIICKSFIECI